jgi:hypothetical protein
VNDNVIPIRPGLLIDPETGLSPDTSDLIERTCQGMVPPDLLQPTAPMPRLRLVPDSGA